jgi:hypothetical protein
MKVPAPAGGSRGVEEQRGRDVVRQIAGDSQGRRQRREIEFERVRLVNRQPVEPTLSQTSAQVAVDLDDVQVLEAREQGDGERSEARPDFDDMIIPPGIDRVDYALDDGRVDEKVLAEPFPRNVPARRHGDR